MRVIKYWRNASGSWSFDDGLLMTIDGSYSEREALKKVARFYAFLDETDIRFEPSVQETPKTVVKYWYIPRTKLWYFSTADLIRALPTTNAEVYTSTQDATKAKAEAATRFPPGAEFVEIPFVGDRLDLSEHYYCRCTTPNVQNFSRHDALSFGRAVHERLEQMYGIADNEKSRRAQELADTKSALARAEREIERQRGVIRGCNEVSKREYERATVAENRVRVLQKELEDARGQLSELKNKATTPPEHPMCRCVAVPVAETSRPKMYYQTGVTDTPGQLFVSLFFSRPVPKSQNERAATLYGRDGFTSILEMAKRYFPGYDFVEVP